MVVIVFETLVGLVVSVIEAVVVVLKFEWCVILLFLVV